MPSFISAAVAALSLSSVASASVAFRRDELNFNSSTPISSLSSTSKRVPMGTGGSSIVTPTMRANSTGTSPSSTATAPATTLSINGVTFRLEIDVTYSGITIELDILAKRAGESLEQCLSTCAASTSCAGTAFDSNSETCTFYRSVDLGSRRSAPGVTFATVQGRATSTNNNGTSVTAVPNSPGGNGSFFDSETLICPLYNDEVLLNTDGSQFLINCGTNAQGTVIGVRKARMIRRQATFGNEWLIDCVDTCTALGNCVATAYNGAQGTCTFYSALEATYADAATDLALLVAEGTDATSSAPGVAAPTGADVTSTITTVPMTTSTVFSTTTRTISSCAPNVINCPARTVTEVVPAYTTVCPVSTAGALATQTVKVCTACQYVPATVTVYQCPTLGSTPGTPVPVTTKVVSVPILNGPTAPLTTSTVYSTSVGVTTSCGPNGCPKVTVTNIVSLYTTVCPASSTGASVPGTTVVPGTTKPESTIPVTTVPGTTGPETTVPASTKPQTIVPGTTQPATTLKPSSSMVVVSNRPSTTSSMVMYTGAAVKNAGMGFAAAVAGAAAFLL